MSARDPDPTLPRDNGPPALGRPAGGGLRVLAAPPAYTLCVVSLYPGGEPDDYLDGQELLPFDAVRHAVQACELYARHPERLPRFDVPGAALLVVNDRHGREVCRRPLLGLAPAAV